MAPVTRGVDALLVPPLRDSPVVMRPTPVDLDNGFVLVVSIGIVAGLTLFVLLQALQALKAALRSREMQERLSTLPLYTKYGAFLLNPSDQRNGYTEEDMQRMNAGLTTGKGGPRLPPPLPRRASRRRLLSPQPTTTSTAENTTAVESSSGSSGAEGKRDTPRRPQLESTVSFGQQSARSHWLGPHRCQFTLSPDEIVTSEDDSGDESDTSSTATFSHAYFPHHAPHHGDAKGGKEKYPYAQGIVHYPKRRESFSNGGRNHRRRPGVYLDLELPPQSIHHGEEEESESGLVSDATMVASAPRSDKFTPSHKKKNKDEGDYFSYVPKRSLAPPVPMQMTRICVVYDDTSSSSNEGTSSNEATSTSTSDEAKAGGKKFVEERRRAALNAALDEANAMVSSWKEYEYTPRRHQRRTQPPPPTLASEQPAPSTLVAV